MLGLSIRAAGVNGPRARAHWRPRAPHVGGVDGRGGGGGRCTRYALGAFDDGDSDGGRGARAERLRALALGSACAGAAVVAADRAVLPAIRIVYVWILISPVLAAYALELASARARRLPAAERARRLGRLHARLAPRVLAVINCVQGGYVKVGQVFSNRRDVLPPAYVSELSTLQDRVTPRPWRQVRRTIERSLRAPLAAHFSNVDAEPIGCASVAQVHRATLASTRELVVIKVQHARARRLFAIDLANIELLAKLVLPPLAPVVSEIRSRQATEFDFAREARSLDTIGASMRARFGESRLVVPRPIGALSSERVLVMQYLPGPTLAAQLAADVRGAVGERVFARWSAAARGDADDGPALRAVDRVRIAAAAPHLWRIRRVVRARLLLLGAAHGEQIFVDGRFNGDPHGGNVLVTTRGRLGLIDYGQVRELTVEQRANLCRLVLALSDPHASAAHVASLFRAMGFRSRDGSEELAARLARIMYDADEACGRPPSAVLRELAGLDAIQSFPLEYVMAARVSLLLRGLGLAFGVRVQTARLWRPYAERGLRQVVMAQAQGQGAPSNPLR